MSNDITSFVAKVAFLVVFVFAFIWNQPYLFERHRVMSYILISFMVIAIVISITRNLVKDDGLSIN